jgi:hypothetical protein
MSARSSAAIAGGVVFVLALLAVQVWVFPTSIAGWVVLVVLGIPVWFALEWVGDKVLSARYFKRLPSVARVALGVPVVAALMAVGTGLAWIVRYLAGAA